LSFNFSDRVATNRWGCAKKWRDVVNVAKKILSDLGCRTCDSHPMVGTAVSALGQKVFRSAKTIQVVLRSHKSVSLVRVDDGCDWNTLNIDVFFFQWAYTCAKPPSTNNSVPVT
jgi:hypothetical protein